MKDTTEFVLLILVGFFIGIMVSLVASEIIMVQPLKQDAVDKGYAYWLVIDNGTGETKFVWKDNYGW